MTEKSYDDYVRQDSLVFSDLRALFTPANVRTVFDIGACEGEDSLRYARLFPNARVYAFEPLPANQALVKAHFKRLCATRCELVPLALSSENGTAVFHVSSGTPEEKPHGEEWNYGNKSSSLLPPERVGNGKDWVPWLKFNETNVVTTATLDDFCAGRGITAIDYAQIDVQGAEWLVLQGARKMLPKIKCLWIEVADAEIYKGQRQRPEIDAYLAGLGFRPVRQVNNGLESDILYVNLRWPSGFRRWLLTCIINGWHRFRMALGRWRRGQFRQS